MAKLDSPHRAKLRALINRADHATLDKINSLIGNMVPNKPDVFTEAVCWDCFLPVSKVGKLNRAEQCKNCAKPKTQRKN